MDINNSHAVLAVNRNFQKVFVSDKIENEFRKACFLYVILLLLWMSLGICRFKTSARRII